MIAVMASATGRILATMVGLRPVIAASTLFSNVYLSMVLCGSSMVGVGFTTSRATMGWPVVSPPVMPPALLELKKTFPPSARRARPIPAS